MKFPTIKRSKSLLSAVCLVLSAVMIALCAMTSCTPEEADEWLELIFGRNNYQTIGDTLEGEAHLKMHVIDIGQGDATLIQCGEKNVLIDCGENGMGETVLDYLDRINVTHLDWLIGTHPHSDHIGGMDTVIKSALTIDNMMMPQTSEEMTPTTKTYTEVLAAAKKKKLKITRPTPGKEYDLDGVTMLVLSPAKKAKYTDLNDYSIVLKFTYKDISILTGGDHHGGKESNTEAFLAEVNPLYCAISCGQDNPYGHPKEVVLERLANIGCQVNRTDVDGDLLYETDGKNIAVTFSK